MTKETVRTRLFDDAIVQRLADELSALRAEHEALSALPHERRGESSESREQQVASLRAALITQMVPLVESVARKFAGGSEPIEDLVGEGYIGLIQAVDGYQCGRGAKFSTYANYRIAGQIRHYLRDRGKIIREPAWLQESCQRLARASEALQAELGRRPSTLEVAERVELTEEQIGELLAHRATFQVVPITAASNDDEDDGSSVDADRSLAQSAESLLSPLENRIFFERLFSQLRENERQAITAFFFQELTQTEIARRLGVSCNYAGHLLKNGLRKLQRSVQSEELQEAHRRAKIAGPPEASVVDPATELYNRDYFRQRLHEETARARRFHRPLGLVLLRIAGDGARGAAPSEETLRELALALRQCLRKADIPCRLSETEFAVILPQTSDPVVAVGQRLRQLAVGVVSGPVGCGTAIYPDAGTSASDLEAMARTRLDESAEAG
jgi:RNA polymerase sigma-B factor